MSEKMLVTQALDERDLLVKKITDVIEKGHFVDDAKHNEERVYDARISRGDFAKDAASSYWQILDLIERYQKINALIASSNATTFIEL